MLSPNDLTERQREVAALVADGWTSKRIGPRLGATHHENQYICSGEKSYQRLGCKRDGVRRDDRMD